MNRTLRTFVLALAGVQVAAAIATLWAAVFGRGGLLALIVGMVELLAAFVLASRGVAGSFDRRSAGFLVTAVSLSSIGLVGLAIGGLLFDGGPALLFGPLFLLGWVLTVIAIAVWFLSAR